MIKKQILNGRNVVEVESNLTELEILVKEAFKNATLINQIHSTVMDSEGMSFHSSNIININSNEISSFNGNLIIEVNSTEFSIAINDQCNILVQRSQSEKLRLFFEDFQMWLSIY